MLIVQKYGGTSLADASRIQCVAQRVAALSGQGVQLVIVVSAMGHTTDGLLSQALSIHPGANPRELDMCLSVGEQLSAALLSMALDRLDCKSISLTGWQAGIQTDSAHQNARIRTLGNLRIRTELQKGNVVVVAGYQGADPHGNITTLGRGGSDTTAVALAAFLQADRCQIFTDVEGVYDRDPRLYPEAVRFDRLSYDRMLQLIGEGAQVLHLPSVELAREHRICIEVLSSFTDRPGTVVGP